MKFDKILEYQKVDMEMTAIEQSFFKNDVYKNFTNNQNKLKAAAAKMKKITQEAWELSQSASVYKEKTENISKQLDELLSVVDEIEDLAEAEHYIKLINTLSDSLAALEKDAEKDKAQGAKINAEWNEILKIGQDLTKTVKQIKPEYDKIYEEVRKQREEVEARLKAIAKDVENEFIEKYIALKKDRKTRAFVKFDPEVRMCCGCNMELSGDTLAKLKKQGDWTECPNCGRILFIED